MEDLCSIRYPRTIYTKNVNYIILTNIITGGKGCNPESVAKNMFSGLRKYIQSSDYNSTLKSIRIVIFQKDMVKKFVDASREESKGSFSMSSLLLNIF